MGNGNSNSNFSKRKSAEQYTKPIPPKDLVERLSTRRIVRNKYGVSIINPSASSLLCKGEVIDVNTAFSGLGMLTENRFAANTPIQIVFNHNNKEIKISGVVIWCNRLPSNNHVIKMNPPHSWRIGVSLTESAENKTEVEYLKSLL